MRRCFLTIAAVLLVCSATAQAQWVWRDAQGRTHMSDLPPPRDVPDSAITRRPASGGARNTTPSAPPPSAVSPIPGVSSASAPALAASSASTVDPALAARRKKVEDEQLAQQKAQEAKNDAIRRENCGRARDQLRTLESGMRMGRVNAKGEREIIDDAQRAAEEQRARAVVASDCR